MNRIGNWPVAPAVAASAFSLLVLCAPASHAQDAQSSYTFSITADTLSTALGELVQATGAQLFYPSESTADVRVHPVIGVYTLQEALSIMLEGTGFSGGVTANGVVFVFHNDKPAGPQAPQTERTAGSAATDHVRRDTAQTARREVVHVDPADRDDNRPARQQTILVTGYRQSLQEGIWNKRNSDSQLESILAEDIGKFPDLNLAEAIQRVPGVAISRESGEGRQITLRGLGPAFTRTTINGMEVPASTDGLDSGDSVNSGRAFDFNVFASELFNRVDVVKTTTASMEEGGIAGTVALYSPRPLAGQGLKVAASAQAGYNRLTENSDPRYSVLFSNTFADDRLGVLLSATNSERTVRQEGFGTVRWTTPLIDGSGPFPDEATPEVIGTPAIENCLDENGQQVTAINCLWFPRLPRPDFFGNAQTRTGLTGVIQYRPDDRLEITFDTLHSRLENHRTNYNFFEFFLSSFGSVVPLSIKVAPDGKQVIAASFDNVESFIESRRQNSDTDFSQYVLTATYQPSDILHLSGLLGAARSQSEREEYRYYMRSVPHRYSFDFTDNPNVPVVTYGHDFNDPSLYSLIDGRLRSESLDLSNLTAHLDARLDLDELTLQTGLALNHRQAKHGVWFIPEFADQPSAVGFTAPFPYEDYGRDFDGELFPFTVANIDKINRTLLDADFQFNPAQSWRVSERTLAGFIDLQARWFVAGMPLKVNSGARIVQTTTTSKGFTLTAPVTVEDSYVNLLPSLNVSLDLTPEVTARFAYGRKIARPAFDYLNPGNPTFSYNTGTVVLGNPRLSPYISDDIDLSLERYADNESLFAITMFNKNIRSYIEISNSIRLIDPIYYSTIEADPEYDPNVSIDFRTVPYLHTTPTNIDGGVVKGIEFLYQQPLSMLPAPFDDLGVAINYTYVDADENITGLSENSSNLTVYYESDRFGGRISLNRRDDYIIRLPGENGNVAEVKNGSAQIDLSAYFNINDQLTLTFEAINASDEYERIYGTGDGSMNLPREYNHTGAQYFLGLRYNF